ncbi:plastocyanin/azurin family copper-binding protein [Albibacterium bauzanense]|uniref:Glucose/arabinose dehydrogenase n=1 Tax=Albibacterium bauzanense TaxID=653929 RepID=A0A4R1LTI3_9SPHI|nr:plastocyanin/azurin family copper-binding protein [Albibacterium bauzanense]TCK82628.1 glucose/arabinose dehydrogenase [Albibacterium bauzanense]
MNLKINYIKYLAVIGVLYSTISFGQNNSINNSTANDTVKIYTENDIYRLSTVPIPQGLLLEVGGMTFLPSGSLAVSTRRGEVWIIDNTSMKDRRQPTYRLFAQGLHEPLGLNYIKGDIYAVQRSELTRLRDSDGDGKADQYETMYSWPLSETGNYHEYAYGPLLDKNGDMIVALNLGWNGNSESLSKWHGWMLKFSPDFKMTPFAAGFRSPAGMGLNSSGDIFYSDNQGHWVGSGFISHVAERDFMGNPSSLKWSGEPESNITLKPSDIPDTGKPMFEVAKTVKGIKTPAVWFPHTILGISTSGILNYNNEGKMGPFEDQLFVGDQGHSKIMRVFLEKVKGVYQGVVFPFREGFSSGILRMNWGPDGAMFVGMTSRGWGSTGSAPFGLQKLEWTGVMPFEMKTIKAQPDGFEIEFTLPVDEKSARDVSSYSIGDFIYKYHSTYGSPPINQADRAIKAIVVSEDKMRVRLVLDSLKEGYIHEIKAEGVLSAEQRPLLHNFGYYTLNNIPNGEKVIITDDNRVEMSMGHDHESMVSNSNTTQAVKDQEVLGKHTVQMPANWGGKADLTITLRTLSGLKFSTDNITVKVGTKLKLVFNNNDDMLHNFVMTEVGAGNEIGELALKLGVQGEKMNYVPNSSKVIAYTKILQPGETQAIYLNVPNTPGVYPYICSYPGHYLVMRGVIRVVK